MISTHTAKEDIFQQQVIKAAQQLYQIYGLHKVTMEDVAKAVGKSKSALYYYYKSKEEIFDAVMAAEISEIIAEIRQAVAEVVTIEQKIHTFCFANLNISRKRRALYSAIEAGMDANEMSAYTKAKQAIHHQVMARKSEILTEIISGSVKKGEIAKQNDKERDVLIFVLLSALQGLKREMIIENDFTVIEAAINSLTMMVTRSLRA